MIEYPYISLPEYFTLFLRSNMQSTGENYSGMNSYAQSSPPLQMIFKKFFKDIDLDGKPSLILKSIGWFGVRNRLADIFLDYHLKDEFSYQGKGLTHTKEIIALENDLVKHSVEGYNRAFLLGFYFQMAKIGAQKVQKKTSFFQGEELIMLLEKAQSKSVKIDWLMVLLAHFSHFMGAEELGPYLNSKAGISLLLECLEDDHKKIFYQNMLNYGASINDPEIFCGKIV